jgi:N,N'-diacetylchitobiose non-reducing end deacetylase
MPRKSTFLVVYPHPDDVEWACPSTILRLTREGHNVYYCQVTDGGCGTLDPLMTADRLRATRRKEIAEAQRILGVKKVFHLDFPDGSTYDCQAVREKIVRIIRTVKADIVFSLDPHVKRETHIDHRTSAWAGIEAASNAGWPLAHRDQIEGEGLKPHMVQQIWLFQTDQPTHYVDVSKAFDDACPARYAHMSQIGFGTLTPAEARTQMAGSIKNARKRAAEFGKSVGVKYAEPFRVLNVAVGHSRELTGGSRWLLAAGLDG